MSNTGFKQKIGRGDTVLGCRINLCATRDEFAAAVQSDSYEFACFDGQHFPYSDQAAVDFCHLAEEFDMPVGMRIKHPREAYLLGNYLDLGATSMEVPLSECESTAQEAVTNFYYPPLGRRSYGGVYRRQAADFDSSDIRGYADWWNETGVLWLQIESLAGVMNAHQLALDGVDCLSFGPSDLTLDIESHPNPRYTTVEECVAAVAESVSPDTALCYRSDRAERQKWADLGATVFLEPPL